MGWDRDNGAGETHGEVHHKLLRFMERLKLLSELQRRLVGISVGLAIRELKVVPGIVMVPGPGADYTEVEIGQ